jgi:hypothetical protein
MRDARLNRQILQKRVQTMSDRTVQELEVVSKIIDELVQEIGAMDIDDPERAKRIQELCVLEDVSVSLQQKHQN